jgi:hypothetical protein
MKRSMAILMVLAMALVWSCLALAEEKKPDATLKLSEGQVAVGIGWSWGKGVLTYQGKTHPFKVKGLSVIDVGISKAEAEGKIYNLKKLEDFEGLYLAASAEGTIALGAGETAMKNKKGVVIYLSPLTKGVNLKLGGEGVNFSLEKK